jgi:hypothetical protein
MAQSWFYDYQGKTHGPFSAKELNDLARRGLLDRKGLVLWEGPDQAEAAANDEVLELADLPPALPDWLADVEAAQRRGPTPPPPPPPEPAEWLEDLRVWIGLDVGAASNKAAAEAPTAPTPAAAPPAQPGAVPDWLQGPGQVPPAQAQPPPAGPSASRVPAVPAGPPAVPAAVAPPAEPAARPEAGDILAEKAVQETGFDPRTGLIVDPARFQQWKVAKSGTPETAGPHTNAALMEVFRKARREIEDWVDDDRHRGFILDRTPAQVVAIARVGGLLDKYAAYGPEMRDKLLQHLALVVHNRQKYFRAAGKQ